MSYFKGLFGKNKYESELNFLFKMIQLNKFFKNAIDVSFQ